MNGDMMENRNQNHDSPGVTRLAPELSVAGWLNTPQPLSLHALRGRVVVIEAFQMLCPGCVSRGLPQAQAIAQTFRPEDVAMIGLHSVFEHHEAQGTETALRAFLHEYRIGFPVAMDMPGEGHPLPRTMAAYEMQGTPTLVLIDRAGRRRAQYFGHQADLRIGAEIMALVAEQGPIGLHNPAQDARPADGGCDDTGCGIG